jgi:hypothetical protein
MPTRVALFSLAGLLLGAPAHAQPSPLLAAWLEAVPIAPFTEPARAAPVSNGDYDRDLDSATWVYLATAAADWTATAACGSTKVRCGAEHQGGLFLHNIKHEAVAVTFGLAIDAAAVYLVREFLAPEYPKVARGLLYVLSGGRVVATSLKVADLREGPK